MKAIKTDKVKAFAHITGGGLVENIPRVLTSKQGVNLDAEKWSIHPVYGWLAALGMVSFHDAIELINSFLGKISQAELLRTFNCGIGAVLIVDKVHEEEILKILSEEQESAVTVGYVFNKTGGSPIMFLLTFNM